MRDGGGKTGGSIKYLLNPVISLIFHIVKINLLYSFMFTTNLKFLDLLATTYFYSRGKYLNFHFINSPFGFNLPPPPPASQSCLDRCKYRSDQSQVANTESLFYNQHYK